MTMTPDRQAAAVDVLKMVREDIPRDMERIEGAPLNGRIVSEAFGRLAAQVDAIANVLIQHLDSDGQPGPGAAPSP